MRAVFAGTPSFAARALAALHDAGHAIALVLTQPDRPAGRGLKLVGSQVALEAERRAIPIAKPSSLRDDSSLALLKNVAPDVIVVAAYGLLLPPGVLRIPSKGCINIHASLLPRWRGAAPIQRALLAGDLETGISIMQMDAGLDTGPVLLEKNCPIGARETTGSLTEKLAALGAEAIVEALSRLGELRPVPQDPSSASHAAKVSKAEARIDWASPNIQIDRLVRAFDPTPGAETLLHGEPLKIWKATPAEGSGAPGKVLYARNRQMRVACGEGALELLEIQRPGARRMGVGDFLQGTRLEEGSVLGHKPLASA